MLISRKPQWGLPAAAMAAALLVAGCGSSSTTGTTPDTATPSNPVASTIGSPPANQLIVAATATDDVTKKVAEEIASAAVATPSLGSVIQSTVLPDALIKKIGDLGSKRYDDKLVITRYDYDGVVLGGSASDGTNVVAPIDGWVGVQWKEEDDAGTLRFRGYGTAMGVMPRFTLGYWLHVPDDATSADSYEVGVFALGSGGFFRADNLPGLTGTATYKGDAVGLHAKRAAVDDTPDINEFTADVALTANFGDNTELGSVSGTVSNFNVGGMEKSLELSLERATITGDRNSGFFKGDTSAAGGFSGKWAGAFYGDGQATTDKPASVIGTFGASNEGGLESFIGAFGAKKQ